MPPKPASKAKGGRKKSVEDTKRGVHFEGAIEKCSKKFGFDFWQSRWFVLTDTKLSYFKTRAEAASAGEGGGTSFSLGSVKGFTSGEGAEFLIQTEERGLDLRAQSEGERDRVLAALEEATRRFRLADYTLFLGGDVVGESWEDGLLPAEWRGETAPFAVTKVFKETREWHEVVKVFCGGRAPLAADPPPLARINRIQNREALKRFREYRSRLSQVLASEGGVTEVEERWAWHGPRTSENAVGIMSRGFDAAGAKEGVAQYGRGCYFSVTPELAGRYGATVSPELASLLAQHPERVAGQKSLLLARILIGDVAEGRFDSPKPPVVVYSPSKRRADTLVDKAADPSIIVSTHTAQCYPAYLITLSS